MRPSGLARFRPEISDQDAASTRAAETAHYSNLVIHDSSLRDLPMRIGVRRRTRPGLSARQALPDRHLRDREVGVNIYDVQVLKHVSPLPPPVLETETAQLDGMNVDEPHGSKRSRCYRPHRSGTCPPTAVIQSAAMGRIPSTPAGLPVKNPRAKRIRRSRIRRRPARCPLHRLASQAISRELRGCGPVRPSR